MKAAWKIDLRIGMALAAGGLAAACGAPNTSAAHALGDPRKGAQWVEREACGSCHMIPSKTTGIGVVGPALGGVARRAIIAGVLPNTPANMVRWLRSPQAVLPRTAMPDMGLTEQQAKDIAAYLYTLD